MKFQNNAKAMRLDKTSMNSSTGRLRRFSTTGKRGNGTTELNVGLSHSVGMTEQSLDLNNETATPDLTRSGRKYTSKEAITTLMTRDSTIERVGSTTKSSKIQTLLATTEKKET